MQYRRYQAPRTSGEVFCDPPLDQLPDVARQGADWLSTCTSSWHGQPLAKLAGSARSEMLELATQYTCAYRDVERPDTALAGPPLVIATGHQPRLFHPGVWYKNFVLAQLAESLKATAIHVVIDNDTAGNTAIRVPAGSLEQPHLETLPLDRPGEDIPFEERAVESPEIFDALGERTAAVIQPFIADPLISGWWPRATCARWRTGNLGLAIAQARHELEGEWGLQTYEVPLSLLCETRHFRFFATGILADLGRFQQIYNQSLREYRRVNHIRSRSHPAPELDERDGWLEAPFWIWTRDQPLRRRLFIRQSAGQLVITDRGSVEERLAWPFSEKPDPAIHGLEKLARLGIKIRPRALLTTMYLRLFLSELFLHGIGGGKYDQLTDEIVKQFLGIDPPPFAVLSATLQLPICRQPVSPAEQRAIDHRLRELTFNPDRYVPPSDEASVWVAEKKKWLSVDSAEAGARRHAAILEVNRKLQPLVEEQRQRLVAQREELTVQLRNQAVLSSREFAFCLFPKSTLLSLLLDKP